MPLETGKNGLEENGKKKNVRNETCVYRDERYVLGSEDDSPYIDIKGVRFRLSCHPYEPCLYITDAKGLLTAVHNAFDPSSVLWSFSRGEIITSITGREYDAEDFCRMVEYAEGLGNIQISDAEKVFAGRPKKKTSEKEKSLESEKTPRETGTQEAEETLRETGTQEAEETLRETATQEFKGALGEKETPEFKAAPEPKNKLLENVKSLRPEDGWIIVDEAFNQVLASYPDCVVDYCLVKNEPMGGSGYINHWFALVWACRKLFIDEEDEEVLWHYDTGKADAKEIPAAEVFSLPKKHRQGTEHRPQGGVSWVDQVTDGGPRPYWQAFLLPPNGCMYTEEDFHKVNQALFPNGTDELEVFQWTTDWSEYFDDGREWWGTLCLTVYDKSLDRFAVIMASATD